MTGRPSIPVEAGALRNRPCGSTKNNSRPSRLQTGWLPQPTEMTSRRGVPSSVWTDTSGRPVSSDTYATNRPSGENRASRSTKGCPNLLESPDVVEISLRPPR